MSTPATWPWIRAEVESAAAAFAATLRQLDESTLVPGLDWTVGELGAHVANFPAFYRQLAASDQPLPAPTDFEAFAQEIMAPQLGRPIADLADTVETGISAWLDELGDDGAAPVMWWVPHTAAGVASAALNELLVHRRDLAALTGEQVNITADQARAILDGIIVGSTAFVDPDVARRCAGTFHISIRGGSDWTIRVADAEVTVERGKPDRADVRTSAEPVSMLLTSLGRSSQAKAALTGKAVAWGRKPWLALRFAKLFNAP